jgi:hypothetical protein
MSSARPGRHRKPARRLGGAGDGFEVTTGRLNGLATLAGNWPSLVLIQTAVIAAQGSEQFVKLALAAQSAGVVVVLVVMLALRRNLAGRWQLVASAWVGVVGMSVIAVRPDRVTLFLGLLVSAWVFYASSTLRTAVSPRAGSAAPGAQSRVQTWMYSTVLVASLVYVAIGRSLTGWRIATVLLALTLAYEGTRLIFAPGRELPDPRRERQPGLHQPVRKVLTYWPLLWAILILTLTYVMLGLYFTDLQTELSHVGWGASQASWIVAAAGASRVLTLRVASFMSRAGEEHHGTALVWSAALLMVSALLAAWPLVSGGRVTAAVSLGAAGIVLQAAMNGCNPLIRAYIGQRSVDASTLVNIGAAAGQAIGTQVAVVIAWTGVVSGWGLAAIGIAVLAIVTVTHRYRVFHWDNTSGAKPPDLPAAHEYWLRGEPGPRGRVRLDFFVHPDTGLPLGWRPLPRREVGPGERVTGLAAFDPSVEFQYWQGEPLLRFGRARRAMPLQRWSPWRLGLRWMAAQSSAVSATDPTPTLVVIGPLDEVLTLDERSQRWLIDPRSLVSHDCTLAEGVRTWRRPRVPFVVDDGSVRGEITSGRINRWRVVRTFSEIADPLQSTSADLPVWRVTAGELAGHWVVRLDQVVGVRTVVFNEVTSDQGFPNYYLESWAHHT